METNIILGGYNNFISEEETISNQSLLFKDRNDSFLSFNDISLSKLSNNNDNSFSLMDGHLGEFMADKVIHNNKMSSNEISSNENKSLNSNDKKEKPKPNLLDNSEKDKNKEKNSNSNNLFKVYPKKEHNKYNRDNIIDKVARNFLNNIYFSANNEINIIKKRNKSLFKNKIFAKITSILIFFQKFKLENLFKLKTKNIFYSDEILKMLNKKELTEKYKSKKKENNYNNKLLIKEIKEIKIDEIKDEEVRKRIININEVMDKPLHEIHMIYLSNDKRYENFNTLIDDMIKLEKNGEDEKYIKRYENVAKSLLSEIDEFDSNKKE